MSVGKRIKELRKAAGYSQEELAEKLCVSRQAVTKWETDAGLPDIMNLQAVSTLFSVSVDILLGQENPAPKALQSASCETSVAAVYQKQFEIHAGAAARVIVQGTKTAEFAVRVSSVSGKDITGLVGVSLDGTGRAQTPDVMVKRRRGFSAAQAREDLALTVSLPADYIKQIELEADAGELLVKSLTCEQFEYDGKLKSASIENLDGIFILNANCAVQLAFQPLPRRVEINQLHADCTITLPAGTPYYCENRGRRCEINAPGALQEGTPTCAVIELNGFASQMTVMEQ
ncbi:MAG: helix-turn-helix transcriptional regulator [Pygmaiobacter sp.]|nr:helix-turn-helix transcriptional regulator [Pygmaiobacter sp.]